MSACVNACCGDDDDMSDEENEDSPPPPPEMKRTKSYEIPVQDEVENPLHGHGERERRPRRARARHSLSYLSSSIPRLWPTGIGTSGSEIASGESQQWPCIAHLAGLRFSYLASTFLV